MSPHTRSVPPEQISIQLYTLRDALDSDLAGTLEALAGIGYQRVEHAGFHGRNAAEFRLMLDEVGLWANSGHRHIPQPFDAAAWAVSLEEFNVLGATDIVEPAGPYQERSADAWRRFAADMNVAGGQARDAGLRLGDHNHAFEWLRLDDGGGAPWGPWTPWDVLTAETDPDLVHLELDVFWAFRGARDPVALLEEHAGRITQLHIKDAGGDWETGLADPGQGVIQFERILAASFEVHDFIVEHDQPADPQATARVGYEFLSTLVF